MNTSGELNFIVQDGTCTDHGFFIPKQQAAGMTAVSNPGVSVIKVEKTELRKVLRDLRAQQEKRLSACGCI